MHWRELTFEETRVFYTQALESKDADFLRRLCLEDLFFLLYGACRRIDMGHPWIYARCREVEAAPDGYIDLWARWHWKSSIITFGQSIKDILNNSEETIGIFSHTRPIAKAFLAQIKREFEHNTFLQNLFPEILYKNPQKESPCWSLDNGITVKRKGNPKEATIEAWGLVDGQPTALHIDTPVLTTKGWKHHGNLCIGDYVFGSDGKPVQVIYNTGVLTDKPCYKVEFDDADIVAAEDHLWPIDRVISPRNKITRKQDTGWKITAREIVKTIDLPISSGENRDKRRRCLSTPVIHPASTMSLIIDPYVLGQWLGDGSSDTGIITTGDYDILRYFKQAGYEVMVAQDRGNYKMFRLLGLREQLKQLGLLWNKHIPIEYLYSSPENRLALFQGLMDSDGSCRKKRTSNDGAQCVFTNTNRTLIEQAHYIAASLGIKPARIRDHHDGNDKHNIRYTFSFTGTINPCPFRLKRKYANCVRSKKNTGRYVRSVSPTDSVPVNCIQVECKDGIYLAGKSLIPTHNSKHYSILNYDDIVTLESVTTPEQIEKTTNAWSISLNLGAEKTRRRITGTRYHARDTYQHIIERGAAMPRIHPATDDGTRHGRPVVMSQQSLDDKFREMGSYVASSQLLLNPLADAQMGFHPDWWHICGSIKDTVGWNIYLLVDPASKKKKINDYTVMIVYGLSPDGNYYILDGIRDRLNLTERTKAVFRFHRKWRPLNTGYEEYGLQADIEHIKYVQEEENYRFNITPLGGSMAKGDRILRLVPDFEQHRVYVQHRILFVTVNGKVEDLTQILNKEFTEFPVSEHDDGMDCAARIKDSELGAKFPAAVIETRPHEEPKYDPYRLQEA